MKRQETFGSTLPRLHVVTDDKVLARPDWQSVAVRVCEAGGPALALHVRGPRTCGREIYRLTAALAPHAKRTHALLFVNDRVDVALINDVDGVHLGVRSLALLTARNLLGSEIWIGASCHDATGAAAAAAAGADYMFLGAIFETPNHPNDRGIGIDGLVEVTGGRSGPVMGIGGIDPRRARSIVDAGAFGAAALRGVWDAEDPANAVREYLAIMTNGR